MNDELRTPETAPKDGSVILGAFGWPWLQPAVWCEYIEEWVTANVQGEKLHKSISRSWENGSEKQSDLIGWMPMPKFHSRYYTKEGRSYSKTPNN